MGAGRVTFNIGTLCLENDLIVNFTKASISVELVSGGCMSIKRCVHFVVSTAYTKAMSVSL